MEPNPVSTAIRILLVDDHPAVRQGLALLLAPEGIVVHAEANGRADAMAMVEEGLLDLALVDLSLGGEDGLTLVAELHGRGVPTLVYSMHEDPQHVHGAFAAGALGYVTKREVHRVLVDAIRDVAQGRRFVSPNAALALASRAAEALAETEIRDLSEQEQQVYHLLGHGEGTIEIAAILHISVRTVESYYARILEKLGLNGMHDLHRHAINHRRDPAS
ncbi:MAG TPA: response regulator transcription factor [Armatimonadota bacterium]|jgi:DNA-binding NarL/FixJ family response regulator